MVRGRKIEEEEEKKTSTSRAKRSCTKTDSTGFIKDEISQVETTRDTGLAKARRYLR